MRSRVRSVIVRASALTILGVLLASALIHNCVLWTLDNALRKAAMNLGVRIHAPTTN